jgi:hypothetical protein
MHQTRSFNKPLRTLSVLFALASAIACGAAAVEPLQGSETHFLSRCSAACGGGLECIEGVCTRSCSGDSECTSLSDAATCSPSNSASGPSRCAVPCSADGECRAQNGDWSCIAASCVGSPALLSSTGPVREASCPSFAGGVQVPREVQTSFEPVPGSVNVDSTFADQGGVYWRNFAGAVFGVKKGATSATTLRAAPGRPDDHRGLIGDANRLYWTEVSQVPPSPPEPSPWRLLSVSKDGGSEELVAESAAQLLGPLGADTSGRLFVTSIDGYLNEVTASHTLERVANIPPRLADGVPPQLVDDQVYWAESEDPTDPTMALFAATPGGNAPLRLRQIEAAPFTVGRGVVLWAPSETRFDPLQVIDHFMMLNENTGCVQSLPSIEQGIDQVLIDERHVYWKSLNVESGPAGLTRLLRVNLRTGRFEELVTPGLEITGLTDFAAQDEDTLYLRQSPDDGLVAVRKPD